MNAGTTYAYGFNGKRKDLETGTQDYGMRIYNSSLGRFLSVDPLLNEYPWNSTYAFAEDSPILFIDLDGSERQKAADGSIILGPFDINEINKAIEANQNKTITSANSKPKVDESKPLKQFVNIVHDVANTAGDIADATEGSLKYSVKMTKNFKISSKTGEIIKQSSKNINKQLKDPIAKNLKVKADKVGLKGNIFDAITIGVDIVNYNTSEEGEEKTKAKEGLSKDVLTAGIGLGLPVVGALIDVGFSISETQEFKLNQLNHLKKKANAEGSSFKDYKDYKDYLEKNFPINSSGTGGVDAKFEQAKPK